MFVSVKRRVEQANEPRNLFRGHPERLAFFAIRGRCSLFRARNEIDGKHGLRGLHNNGARIELKQAEPRRRAFRFEQIERPIQRTLVIRDDVVRTLGIGLCEAFIQSFQGVVARVRMFQRRRISENPLPYSVKVLCKRPPAHTHDHSRRYAPCHMLTPPDLLNLQAVLSVRRCTRPSPAGKPVVAARPIRCPAYGQVCRNTAPPPECLREGKNARSPGPCCRGRSHSRGRTNWRYMR